MFQRVHLSSSPEDAGRVRIIAANGVKHRACRVISYDEQARSPPKELHGVARIPTLAPQNSDVAVGLPIVRGIEIIENQNQISSEDIK